MSMFWVLYISGQSVFQSYVGSGLGGPDDRSFEGPIMVKYIYNSKSLYNIVESGSFSGNIQVQVQLVTVSL